MRHVSPAGISTIRAICSTRFECAVSTESSMQSKCSEYSKLVDFNCFKVIRIETAEPSQYDQLAANVLEAFRA